MSTEVAVTIVRRAALLALAILSGGCGSESAGAFYWETWDTVFVREASAQDTSLLFPAWVVPFRDGVVVLDGNLPRVTAFRPNGSVKWIYGRAGDGPAEMRSTWGAVETPEGLWVLDVRGRRLVLLSERGEYRRQVPLPASAGGPQGIAALPGGEVLLHTASRLVRLSLGDGHLISEVPTVWSRPPPTDWLPMVSMASDGVITAVGMRQGPEILLLESDSVHAVIFNEEITYALRPRRVGQLALPASDIIHFGAWNMKLVDSELWVLTGGIYQTGGNRPNDQLVVYSRDGVKLGGGHLPVDAYDFAVTASHLYAVGVGGDEGKLIAFKRP